MREDHYEGTLLLLMSVHFMRIHCYEGRSLLGYISMREDHNKGTPLRGHFFWGKFESAPWTGHGQHVTFDILHTKKLIVLFP